MSEQATNQQIGFIGVGKMGAAMWRCLKAAGHTAAVFDAYAPATKPMADAGATVASSPADLVAQSDIVILSLPNSGDVEGVVSGPDGIAASLRPGAIVIDTTSGEPATSRRVAAAVAAAGADYLDAGVSGGPPGADAGTLKIMVGGEAEAYARAQAVLDILGSRIWHCGGPGTGHAMKTALNLSNQGKMLLEIEALLMCGRAGLDPDQVADVLELNTWRHFLLGEGGRVPFGFAIDLAVKDWGVAAGVASEHRVPMPIAGAAMQTMRAIRAEAGPDADLIDAVSVMEKWAEYDLDAGLGRSSVMRHDYQVIDADAHVIEPDDLWSRYFDPELAHRAPRHLNRAFAIEVDGHAINTPADWEPGNTSERTARRDERISATFAELFPNAYARGFDAVAQLADMDVEGVDLAFLYPSFGLFATASNELDPVVADATCRAYNNWLADFCAGDPDRLFGVGMLALQDPDRAATEVVRIHDELGFRAVFARPNPINDRNLDDAAYEPVWRALSELHMTIGLHEGGMPPLPQVGSDRLTNAEQKHICSHPMEQMVAAVSLIYGGVLERFPGLRVAFLEAGCGWVPFWLERMDDHYEKGLLRDFGASNNLAMLPSEYFARQCFVSADADEHMLGHVIALLGDDHIVFSTDYPHPDSKFPQAVESFLELDGVSDESKRRILWDNARNLYNLG